MNVACDYEAPMQMLTTEKYIATRMPLDRNTQQDYYDQNMAPHNTVTSPAPTYKQRYRSPEASLTPPFSTHTAATLQEYLSGYSSYQLVLTCCLLAK